MINQKLYPNTKTLMKRLATYSSINLLKIFTKVKNESVVLIKKRKKKIGANKIKTSVIRIEVCQCYHTSILLLQIHEEFVSSSPNVFHVILFVLL